MIKLGHYWASAGPQGSLPPPSNLTVTDCYTHHHLSIPFYSKKATGQTSSVSSRKKIRITDLLVGKKVTGNSSSNELLSILPSAGSGCKEDIRIKPAASRVTSHAKNTTDVEPKNSTRKYEVARCWEIIGLVKVMTADRESSWKWQLQATCSLR